MIRFAWLQSRTQTIVAGTALAMLAVVLAVTGANLAHLYETIIAPCTTGADCSPTTIELFLRNRSTLRNLLGIAIAVVPGIIGVFWGAPLVARELEAGTFRLAWTQSVTRTRWMSIKLAVTALISMTVVGLLSLMITWWAHPLDRVRGDAFATFDMRDIVPVGYAAFAFVLGVTVGVLIRRTLPAMAAVLVVFTAIRVAMNHWVRARLIAPLHRVVAIDPTTIGGFGRTNSGPITLQPAVPRIPNSWIYSVRIVDNAGRALTSDVLTSTCPNLREIPPVPVGGTVRSAVPGDIKDSLNGCVTKIGATYHELVTYQPGSRYWAFQWYELAIYLGAAVLLAGFSIWWVSRRLS